LSSIPNDMLPANDIIALSLIIFIASLVRGFTGFGLALVAVPLIQFFLPVSDTAVFIALVNICFSLLYFRRSKRYIKGQPIGTMALWTGAGVAAGTVILKFVNPAYIQLVWGVLILLIVIALIRGVNFGIRSERSAFRLSGMLGGILAGATGITGPPVAIILSSVKTPKEKFSAVLSLFILFAVSFAFVFYYAAGLIHVRTLLLALTTIPAMLAGLYIGDRLVSRINQKTFTAVIYVVLVIMGIITLYKGTKTLLLF
jgi:uncharacterized membrane protein YfcA